MTTTDSTTTVAADLQPLLSPKTLTRQQCTRYRETTIDRRWSWLPETAQAFRDNRGTYLIRGIAPSSLISIIMLVCATALMGQTTASGGTPPLLYACIAVALLSGAISGLIIWWLESDAATKFLYTTSSTPESYIPAFAQVTDAIIPTNGGRSHTMLIEIIDMDDTVLRSKMFGSDEDAFVTKGRWQHEVEMALAQAPEPTVVG